MSQIEKDTPEILETPLWVSIVRGFQILISLIVLALSGSLIHDAYLDEEGFAVAVPVLTWIIVAYVILSEKLPVLQPFYHIIAVMALEAFMVILWLACFAAVAAKRAAYKFNVSVSGCYNDGSLVGSSHCFKARSNVIMFDSGLKKLSAIAGLGALVWLLFIASFVWTVVMFFKARKEGRFQFNFSSTSPAEATYQMESKVQQPAAPAGFQPTPQQPAGQYPAPGPYDQTQSPYPPQYPPQDQAGYQQPGYQQPGYQQPEVSGYQAPPTTTSPPPQQHQQQHQQY